MKKTRGDKRCTKLTLHTESLRTLTTPHLRAAAGGGTDDYVISGEIYPRCDQRTWLKSCLETDCL